MSNRKGFTANNRDTGAVVSLTGIFLYFLLNFIASVILGRNAGISMYAFTAVGEAIALYIYIVCAMIIPAASARVIIRYADRGDVKTVGELRRRIPRTCAVIGTGLGAVIAAAAGTLAERAVSGSILYASLLKTSLYLIALCAILQFMLAGLRGFYQAFKSPGFTARLLSLEQLIRFLVGTVTSLIAVRLMHADGSVIMICFAAGHLISCAATFILYLRYDKEHIAPFLREERLAEGTPQSSSRLASEIARYVLPYVICLVMFGAVILTDMVSFSGLAVANGMNSEKAFVLFGIRWIDTLLLFVLPVVFVFVVFRRRSYVSQILYHTDDRTWLHTFIPEMTETLALLLLPLMMISFSLAGQLFTSVYGQASSSYGEMIFLWFAPVPFFMLMAVITTAVMLNTRLKKEAFFYLLIGILFKCLIMFLGFGRLGYQVSVISSLAAYIVVYYLNMAKMHNRFALSFGSTFKRILRIILACLAMNGIIAGLKLVNATAEIVDAADAAWLTFGYIAAALIGYGWLTTMLMLPDRILHSGWLRLIGIGKGKS